jgi:tetratricopeptide (TPR) repeat protein
MKLIPNKTQWGKWSLPSKYAAIALIIGVIGIIITIIFWYNPKESPIFTEETALTEETKEIIEELLLYNDSLAAKNSVDLLGDLIKNMSEELQTNPYNVRALIMRGQLNSQIQQYRQAIRDYENASKIRKNLADPYFGLGTIYYFLANLDIVKRKLYKIHNKGAFRIENVERRPPLFEILPDERINSLLLAALNKFQKGKNLQSTINYESGFISVFFAPEDIDNRIKSIRSILKYDPPLTNDLSLFMAFTICYSSFGGNILDLYDFSSHENDK